MNEHQIIRIFEKQGKLDKNLKHYKELFELTINFTLDDWRVIRTKKYWDTYDNIPILRDRYKYTLKCVKYYLKHIKK